MRPMILLAIPILLLPSCAAGVLEQGEDLRLLPLLEIVLDRHDTYVEARIEDPDKQVGFLADSAALRAAFQVPTIRAQEIQAIARRVLDRHDAFVVSDHTLDPDHSKMALFSSRNIRRTIDEAADGK